MYYLNFIWEYQFFQIFIKNLLDIYTINILQHFRKSGITKISIQKSIKSKKKWLILLLFPNYNHKFGIEIEYS